MTRLMLVKLGRDMRASWSRFVLMVIAIAVSLTVFGGVLYAWGAGARETSKAYLGTEPASATILLDHRIEAEQMAEIATEARTLPGVIDATGRTQFNSEIEVNGSLRENPMQIFVATPEDPMTMAIFDVDDGSWPPAPGEILIGRDTLTLLDVAIGDILTVEAPTGASLQLRVAGVVYDPSLAPAPQEQRGHAYLSTASLPNPGEDVLLDQLKIQVADPGEDSLSRDRDAIARVAGEVSDWLQREHDVTIREIQVPEPYAHPHQRQADALLVSLAAGGATALLLSTILVANMLNGLFTQQIPQIGIMKAIGARSGPIAGLYLSMTLLVAAAATVLALAPAILIGRAGVLGILGFLGIEATSLAAPTWTYAVVIGTGLVMPPLMTLIPLVKTAGTTVRAAIDHRGLGSSPPATGLWTRFARIRGLNRGLLLALRNTIRRPARFLLSVGLLASAGTVFVAGLSLSAGVEAIEEEQSARRTWDVDVQLTDPIRAEEITEIVKGVPRVSRVEGWARAQTGLAGPGQAPLTRTYPDQGHGGVSLVAVPAGTTIMTPPRLLEGRWLSPEETGTVVLNQIARDNTVPDIDAGDTVQLFIGGQPTTWTVVGIAEERGGGGGVYVTAAGLADATGRPGQVNQLRIVTDNHDEPTRQAVANEVEESLADAGVGVDSATSVSRSEAITEGHLGPIIMILLAIAVAMGVVGAIGLASTMSANVLDRTREFGVMHAVGALPTTVRRIVMGEGVFLALASCLAAVIPTLLLTAVIGAGLGNLFLSAPLPYRVSVLAAGIWVVLVVLGALLATDAAATRASRLTVREALAYL